MLIKSAACMAGCDKALHPAIGQRMGRAPGVKGSLRRAAPALDSGPRPAASLGGGEEQGEASRSNGIDVPKWSLLQPT
jgi:hypothetical protein